MVIVVVLAGVIAGGVAISTSGSGSQSFSKSSAAPASPPSVGDVGKAVEDSGLRFSVSGLDCSAVTDKGKTCLVALHVQNAGTEAQTLTADAQYLIDSKGKKYAGDSAAPAGQESASPFREFAAGDSADGQMAFTIPADAEVQKVELHGSASSEGVVLTLWTD